MSIYDQSPAIVLAGNTGHTCTTGHRHRRAPIAITTIPAIPFVTASAIRTARRPPSGAWAAVCALATIVAAWQVYAGVRLRRTLSATQLLSTRDPLTGLANRRFLEQELAGDPRGRAITMVGLLDLDDFKAVNDTYGHTGGDALLVTVARRLQQALGDNGFVARLGGDEFVLVWRSIPGLRAGEFVSRDSAEREGRRILAHLSDDPVDLTAMAATPIITGTTGVLDSLADTRAGAVPAARPGDHTRHNPAVINDLGHDLTDRPADSPCDDGPVGAAGTSGQASGQDQMHPSASLGMAVVEPGLVGHQVLYAADMAMYAVKARPRPRRSCVQVHVGARAVAAERRYGSRAEVPGTPASSMSEPWMRARAVGERFAGQRSTTVVNRSWRSLGAARPGRGRLEIG